MSRRHLWALALLLLSNCLVFMRAQELPERVQSDRVIRVNVVRVNVGVTVTDSGGQFIRGLSREDFKVFDNGQEQPITSFASNDGPTQVVMVVECGAQDALLAKLGRSPFVAANRF